MSNDSSKLKRRRQRMDSSAGRARSGAVSHRSHKRDSDSGSGSTSPSSAPPALKRTTGSRSLVSRRPDTGRARANARADLSVNQVDVARPPALLKREQASRNVIPGKSVDKSQKPKRDLGTGRLLFPSQADGGKVKYLPLESEASDQERRLGLFVANDSVRKEPVNQLLDGHKTVQDAIKVERRTPEGDDWGDIGEHNRTLFATETADGKLEYLPKQSEASAAELSQGKYVRDDQVEIEPVANELLTGKRYAPVYQFTQQRNVYATRNKTGEIVYLPKRSQANGAELKNGQYIDDQRIRAGFPPAIQFSLSNKKPRYDLGKERKVFPVKTVEGKTLYLPRQSEADAFERARGLFIDDDELDIHERKRRRTALKHDDADVALRRAQRAASLVGGVNSKNVSAAPEPVTHAMDGSELWDGFSLPDIPVNKQVETLKKLRPKYDLYKQRLLYPTETAMGKVEYLPLLADATPDERIDQRYAAFVPREPLAEFIAGLERNGQLNRQRYDTEDGKVKAFSQVEIDDAVAEAPELVLRSARLASDMARASPELQQVWEAQSPAGE